VGIHGGYASLSPKVGSGSISGPEVGAGGGIDYYFSGLVSVGADATLDVMFLSASGQSATGWGVAATAHGGLHFDL
jgi:hypothetical protein